MSEGALAARCLRLVEGTLEEREERIITQVCGKLRKGEALEPQEAVQAWVEVAAGRQLKTHLNTKAALEK